MSAPRDWKIQSAKAKAIQENSIPKQWLLDESRLPPPEQKNVLDFARASGALSEKELSITEMSASVLVAEMGAGKLSAEEVVVAFLKRSVIGQQLLNFATEFMADRAIARAKELDQHYRQTGQLIGPLHGVPISVKEHVGVKGLTLNASFAAWVDEVSPEDAVILQYLEKAGAVFHIRTNEPQCLMHLCSCNNLTGQTLNPHNRTLSPGGSSGGEGVASSFRCSPLGIGSDIGGSVRVPAAFCGSYGFKPSSCRIPTSGIKAAGMGQESVKGVLGPLASSSIDDLDLFQRAILDQEPWDVDTSLMPLPWRRVKQAEVQKMTVGIMWDDGLVRPHPPVTRALADASKKLAAAGINVVDWEPYKHDHGVGIISTLFFPDAAQTFRSLLEQTSEPIHPLTEWAFSFAKPEPLSIPDNWALNKARDIYRDEYHALLKARGVDFLLTPVYPGVAAVLGESHYLGYTSVWNILDQPAVVFPTGTTVDPQLDPADETYTARSDFEEKEWKKYRPERFENAPVALQLVGRKHRDEETIAAGKLVDSIMRQ